MEKFDLIIIEQAFVELQDSCEFYNSKIRGLGDEFNNEVFELLDRIQDNPLLFPVKFEQIHEAVLYRFPFVVTYEIIEKTIVVLSVFHTKQNPKKKTRKLE